jgi:hypothetical protein
MSSNLYSVGSLAATCRQLEKQAMPSQVRLSFAPRYRSINTTEIAEVPGMSRPKNVLWIMCDQLRFDYLGCTGHPVLKTPNIDAMARRGVRFSNAYVQSPICGPSRMSFYIGHYMRSHGSHWNGWPLRVGEPRSAIT